MLVRQPVLCRPIFTHNLTANLNTFLQTLVDFPQLRELIVDDHQPHYCHFFKISIPNLPQLETFFLSHLTSNCEEANIFVNQSWNSLKRFGIFLFDGTRVDIVDNPFVVGQTYTTLQHKQRLQLRNDQICKRITHLSTFEFEYLLLAHPERFLFKQFPSLTHLSITSMISLKSILTRYRLHLLLHLEILQIRNFCASILRWNTHALPEQLMPPACHNVKYLKLRQLIIVNSPHCSMDQFETCMPALRQVQVYRDPNNDYLNVCEKCISDPSKSECEQTVFAESIRRWKIAPKVLIHDIKL